MRHSGSSAETPEPAGTASPETMAHEAHEPGWKAAPQDASGTTPVVLIQRLQGAAPGAAAALIALIVLSVAWEWWLAPLRPGGTALVLKAVPLLLALPGVLRRRLYTLQWASMLILLYFAEGIVRGMSDRGLSARLGWLETLLAVIFFVCALVYVAPFKRAARRARRAT
jgi:uncharacterized membrane protein